MSSLHAPAEFINHYKALYSDTKKPSQASDVKRQQSASESLGSEKQPSIVCQQSVSESLGSQQQPDFGQSHILSNSTSVGPAMASGSSDSAETDVRLPKLYAKGMPVGETGVTSPDGLAELLSDGA